MAGQIRLTPGEMRGRANEVREEGNKFQGVIDQMTRIINVLQTEWEGAAARSFAEQFESLKPSFNSMKELLEDISTQLNQTADAVEQMDQEIASKFGVK
jgi:WXG100 family type VII secretion target